MSYDLEKFLNDARKLVEVSKSLNNFSWNLIEVNKKNQVLLVIKYNLEQP